MYAIGPREDTSKREPSGRRRAFRTPGGSCWISRVSYVESDIPSRFATSAVDHGFWDPAEDGTFFSARALNRRRELTALLTTRNTETELDFDRDMTSLPRKTPALLGKTLDHGIHGDYRGMEKSENEEFLAPGAERLLYPVSEAARLLGISRSQAYKVMDRGDLPYVHIGTRRLVSREDLLAYVELLRKSTRLGLESAASA